MKINKFYTMTLTVMLAASVATPVQAGETKNLFLDAGPKQTHKDFKPAPAAIKTQFGDLSFVQGVFPDKKSAEKIYAEMDLQRATQAYMDFFPAASVYSILKAQFRDFNLKSSSDVGVMADFMTPSENYLTGNNVTVYAVANIDLKIDGPTVMEAPPGMLGTVDDASFSYITDIGLVGPDKGKGGKYLFVPPGYKGDIPDGYYVFHSRSYRIWPMMRVFGAVGTGDAALKWFKERLKIYPLATGPREGNFINVSGMGANTLPPEDGSYFEMLHEIIQYEPTELFDKENLGRLATLGIEKGKPFNPDARMRGIFEQAAKQGVAMCRAIVFASRDPEIRYWEGRQWEKMFVRNTEFLVNGHNDVDARTLWFYPAIVISPHLLSTTPGAGTSYLTAFRDKEGTYLNGAKSYKLTVPANPPVKQFWAVTAYNPASRSLLDSGGNINVGSLGKPMMNKDGTVDVYFGPEAPKDKKLAKNWVKTDPSKGFFVVFRFYGPLEGFIDKTWMLNDFELVK